MEHEGNTWFKKFFNILVVTKNFRIFCEKLVPRATNFFN